MLPRLPSATAIACAALAFALLFIFFDQAHDTGLQRGHRGWCSANVLAIIDRATPENGFVGYTLVYQREGGRLHHVYFDRYPVFFSAAMHVVLNTFELSRGEQIFVARQAMNALYAGSVIMAVLFLMELGFAAPIAIGAATLAASGKLLVTYRDMIHFDHAALFGFVTLLWAIARWYRLRSHWLVYVATAFAVCMGRGYASFAVLAVWWCAEAVIALRAEGRSLAVLKRIAVGPATRCCLLAIGIAVACLTYNITWEAKTNDVRWTDVGIVNSAKRRLVSTDSLNAAQKKKHAWGQFSEEQLKRFVANVQPLVGPGVAPKKPAHTAALALLAFAAIGVFIARRKPELRPPLIVAALSGIVWIVAMRKLTAFHDFTIMFMFPATTLLMLALVAWIPDRAKLVPALVGCAVLVGSTSARNQELRSKEHIGEVYTEDLARIAEKLEPGVPYRTEPKDRKKVVPGVPYALGFFLPHNPLVDDGPKPRTLISTKKDKKGAGKNLTPENKKLFLYRE